MKKLIAICLFMATAFTINAQTKEETLEWLKSNQTEQNFRYPTSNSLNEPRTNKLEMSSATIKLYNPSGAATLENWKDITNVTIDKMGYNACIVNLYFKNQYKGEPVFIKIGCMNINPSTVSEKFKLMATLNNAKIEE